MGEQVIIACSAWKGGVGKSTTSIYLAALLARDTGARVALVDRDASRNLTAMVAQRPDLHDELVTRGVDLLSGEEIPPRGEGFAYIIIDTPPGDGAIASLRDATLVVLPVKPEDQSIGNFVKHLEQLDDARLAVSPRMRLLAALPTMVWRTGRSLVRQHQDHLDNIAAIAARRHPPLPVLPYVPLSTRVMNFDLDAPEYWPVAEEILRYVALPA
jgi:cellulose biosynthesis protein BcsQ